jgi:hypothetical protein
MVDHDLRDSELKSIQWQLPADCHAHQLAVTLWELVLPPEDTSHQGWGERSSCCCRPLYPECSFTLTWLLLLLLLLLALKPRQQAGVHTASNSRAARRQQLRA